MKFKYRIVGRHEGYAGETNFDGEVKAETPKEATLAALAAAFGNPNKPDSRSQLDGWIELPTLDEQYAELDNEDDSFQLTAPPHEFFVDVEAV